MKRKNMLFYASFTLFSFFILNPFLFGPENLSSPTIERLKRQIEIGIKGVEGVVGVAVKHLESGQELYINGDIYFPMASVFKVPILVEVLAQVKEGKFSLEDEVNIQKADQHFGSGIISALTAPGVKLSVRNLVNLMMIISDNSATDILLEKVGPPNVNSRLREYGIDKMTVNRTCQRLIMDFIGLEYEKYRGRSLEELSENYKNATQSKPEAFREALKKFSQKIEDQSTPQAMNTLLEKILKKEILDDQSCDLILSIMLNCQTGESRIKGQLPPGTKVAHKTGTIGGTVNDSGIIYLPENLGHVILTVFTKDFTLKTADVEEIIAKISRLAFDYFYFTLEAGSFQKGGRS